MCSLQNKAMKKQLLAEDKLTMARALEVRMSMEAEDKNAKS